MITVINNGGSYSISFPYRNNSSNIAVNVLATVTVGAGLTLDSITSGIGASGPGSNEYSLGNLTPNYGSDLVVNVTVTDQTANLDVTVDITSDNSDTNVSNNSKTKNLLNEVNGILCEDINSCGGDSSTALRYSSEYQEDRGLFFDNITKPYLVDKDYNYLLRTNRITVTSVNGSTITVDWPNIPDLNPINGVKWAAYHSSVNVAFVVDSHDLSTGEITISGGTALNGSNVEFLNPFAVYTNVRSDNAPMQFTNYTFGGTYNSQSTLYYRTQKIDRLEDGTYVAFGHMRYTTHIEIVLARSNDLVNWTLDATPFISQADVLSIHGITGSSARKPIVLPLNNGGTSKYLLLYNMPLPTGGDEIGYRELDKDLNTIEDGILDMSSYYADTYNVDLSGATWYNGELRLFMFELDSRVGTDNRTYESYEIIFESDDWSSIKGGSVNSRKVLFHEGQNYAATSTMRDQVAAIDYFVYNGDLYAVYVATEKGTGYITADNAQSVIARLSGKDDWAHNGIPYLMNPIQWNTLSGDFTWCRDHVGVTSIFTINGEYYSALTMNNGADTYQTAIVKINFEGNNLPLSIPKFNHIEAAALVPNYGDLIYVTTTGNGFTAGETYIRRDAWEVYGSGSGGGSTGLGLTDTNFTALTGDGSASRIEIPDSPSLSFSDNVTDFPFTMSWWIKPNETTAFGLMSQRDEGGNDKQLSIYVSGTGTFIFGLYEYNGSGFDRLERHSTSAPITSGVWQMITCTYDGSSTVGGLTVYLNDSVMATSPVTTGTYATMGNLALPYVLMDLQNASGYTLDGSLFSTAIFSSELSAAEVTELYNLAGEIEKHSQKDNLELLYNFDNKSGTISDSDTILDKTRNLNNGNIVTALGLSYTSDSPSSADGGTYTVSDNITVDNPLNGIILTSPDGNSFIVRVENNATLRIDPINTP